MSSSTNTPERELASIRQELNELRSALGAMRSNGNGNYNSNGTSFLESAESTALTDRRGMMKKMAGLAVGVAAVGLLKPMTAKASGKPYTPSATGGNMIIGNFNAPTNAPDRTAIINPGSVLFPLLYLVDNYNSTIFTTPANSFISVCGHVNDAGATPANGNLYGVYGQSVTAGNGLSYGVVGLGTTAGVSASGGRGVIAVGAAGLEGVNSTCDGGTNGWAIYGTSDIGVGGVFVGGRAAISLFQGAGAVANPNITNPAGSTNGDFYRGSTNGSVWFKTTGANAYRRLADATTAGALSLLASPVRYIDTRNGTGDPGGAYTAGTVRQYNFVTLQAGTVPSGARGIVGNIVAVSPQASGNMQINSVNSFPGGFASVINFNPNQDIANHFVIALDASGNMYVKGNPNAGNLHLVIDIYGYYL